MANFPKLQGEIIDEETLNSRVMEAVRFRLENDIQDTIDLHNFLCDGQVEVHESAGGEPLGKDGKVIACPLNEAWTYLVTKGD